MTELVIDDAMLAAAERLLGVTYTDAERAQMRDNLAGQVDLAVRRRALRLPNALPPATLFDPRLRGFAMPAQPAMNVPRAAPSLPGDDDAIAFAPVAHLSCWLASGQLTSVRLTRIYLERIRRHDKALLSFATVCEASALAEAEAADARLAAGVRVGPLNGIPYAAKDILDTAGIVTGWGAEPFRDRVPATDATVVRLLRQAGAVLIGKTSVGALAYGDIWYGGRTRNPWNTEEGSSGSSAGSASAVAAGLCGFALGTETLGSIVSPSARCGATGLRPTFGRVGRGGAMALCWSLDKIGPITRAVADTALVLAAINGWDDDDLGSIAAPFGWDATAAPAGLRVGFVEALFADPLDQAALQAARDVGAVAVPVTLPDLPYDALRGLLFAEAAAAFEELTLDDTDDTLARQDPGGWPNSFRKARFLSAVDHIQLDRLRRQVMQEMDRLFRHVDVLLAPAMTGPLTVIGNMTGHPCLTLRTGFADLGTRQMPAFLHGAIPQDAGPTHSVPHAITVVAPLFAEAQALTLGAALEARLGVAGRRPKLA